MSNGHTTSHQYAGLNRVGKYLEPAREKGPGGAGVPPANSLLAQQAGGTPAPHNEKWRRWTGIVGADAQRLNWKQRRRGVRRLIKQIERTVALGLEKQGTISAPKCGMRSNWGGDLDGWSRVQCAGRSVESVCVEFGISRGQLNALTREYCSLSASDVIDGYKIRGLKKVLIAQLREAAFGLWGGPGDFAKKRCMEVCHGQPAVGCPCGSRENAGPANTRREAARATAANDRRRCPWHTPIEATHRPSKRSKYFRTRPSEFFGLEPGEEERIRLSELLGKLDALREEGDWRVDNLAVQLGFENAGAFRRACLNVMGRTMEQLERILARDVVEYYLAAEDRELRELARQNTDGAKSPAHCIYAAREIYGCGEEAPQEPFLDRWSASEFAKPEWISAMREEFG